MRRAIIAGICLLLAAASVQPQDRALDALVNQAFILPAIAEGPAIHLDHRQIHQLRGACDRAVLVRAAEWKPGTVQIQLENIGSPAVMGKSGNGCATSMSEMTLKVTGFANNEPAESIFRALRRILNTPEVFLNSREVPFALPAGPDPELILRLTEAKIPPPQLLLRVDGSYTDPALKARRRGTVKVEGAVAEDGRLHGIRVVQGLGFGLDERVLQALALWRFLPAQQNGRPVAVSAKLDMAFEVR